MGAGASTQAPFTSIEEALAAGKTQDEVDQWQANNNTGETKEAIPDTKAIPADSEAPPAESEAPPAESEAPPSESEASAVTETAPSAETSPPEITDIDMTAACAIIKDRTFTSTGKWPLFLDGTDGKGFITFLNYQSYKLVEVKKGMAEVSIKKSKSVEEVREEWRKDLVSCMLQKNDLGSGPGKPLWLHFANSAVAFKGTYCNEADLSIDMFDATLMQNEETKKKFIKEGELENAMFGSDFSIFLTSEFQKEDAVEFLEKAIPLDKFTIYNVINK